MKNIVRTGAEIRGIVQGVGFRPFVYGLALRRGLGGVVRNTSYGAFLEVEGALEDVEAFFRDLIDQAPPLSRITGMNRIDLGTTGQKSFGIDLSQALGARSALISPDVAVCAECLAEMFDPANRRFRYPFINCTNCGPRYTIIKDVPYDRDKTSMAAFPMCPDCTSEYHDPSDRRFHAQPNACPVCGPRVWLADAAGSALELDDPVREAIRLLLEGHILAIKGLGGFHLAVDAQNDPAVRRLRARKHREEKPLAVMCPDLDAARRIADFGPLEQEILTSNKRPIVLLPKAPGFPLARNLAPDNPWVGVMLPYTPLHHLVLKGFSALVMTSGNLSEEPIAIDNQEAFSRLGGIADFFLVHDRDIVLRTDDSVVRILDGRETGIRRSRGVVPAPVFLRQVQPPLLAVGGEQKNVVCLTKENRAFLSQHIGDLEHPSALDFFEATIRHLERILDIVPEAVVHDLHPGYFSTQWAQASNLPLVGVQHHHAHVASVMAEHHLDGPVIGLACDGTGWGRGGIIWGGEVLIADETGFERVGHLDEVVLPGGEAAIKEPWRMALSHLAAAFGSDLEGLDLELRARIDPEKWSLVRQVVEKRIRSPLTSSLGRLFDAAASLVGLKDRAAYEGQPAIMLEMVASRGEAVPYDFELTRMGQTWIIYQQPMIRELVKEVRSGRPVAEISGRFHQTVVEAYSETVRRVSGETGIRVVALSGGCFQNHTLAQGIFRKLRGLGLEVFGQVRVPANDGGLCLGQALIAGRRLTA